MWVLLKLMPHKTHLSFQIKRSLWKTVEMTGNQSQVSHLHETPSEFSWPFQNRGNDGSIHQNPRITHVYFHKCHKSYRNWWHQPNFYAQDRRHCHTGTTGRFHHRFGIRPVWALKLSRMGQDGQNSWIHPLRGNATMLLVRGISVESHHDPSVPLVNIMGQHKSSPVFSLWNSNDWNVIITLNLIKFTSTMKCWCTMWF
jgi:hypothetical protein